MRDTYFFAWSWYRQDPRARGLYLLGAAKSESWLTHGVGAKEPGGAGHFEEQKTRSGCTSWLHAREASAGGCGARSECQQGPAGLAPYKELRGPGGPRSAADKA